jgi:putative RNA 2'-phosphotransferase
MNPLHIIEKRARLAAYILGRHPDEFGLVLDKDGYIAVKELLKAIHEIDGWKHIRMNHLYEIILSARTPTIEIHDGKIRAKVRDLLPAPVYCPSPPKLVYVGIRPKAYFTVAEHGIRPTWHPSVVCSEDKALAEKIGKRRDAHPVLLTIHTARAIEKGVVFHQYGDTIFLADLIPLDCFTGPPLPKEKPQEKYPDSVEAYRKQSQAGSFQWSPEQSGFNKYENKKNMNWKKDKKRLRRKKKNFWPE